MALKIFKKESPYPPLQEPAWAPLVDRWYQLDARAFALTDLGYELKEKLPLPEAIILASPGASNASDFQFVEEGAASAVQFAHTLPNVRISPLLQVLDWKGPVLCLQFHPFERDKALEQAPLLFPQKRVWIFSVQNGTPARTEAFSLDLTHGIKAGFQLPGK